MSAQRLPIQAGAMLIAASLAVPSPAIAGTRSRLSVRITPVITSSVLVKEAQRHTRASHLEAEARIFGARVRNRLGAHEYAAGSAKPIVIGVRSGNPVISAGRAISTVIVSVLSYGLYATDTIPVTRRIDYMYNAQNGVLLAESAVIADPQTSARYGLPVFVRTGGKK